VPTRRIVKRLLRKAKARMWAALPGQMPECDRTDPGHIPNSRKNSAGGYIGRRCFAFPPRCCDGSAAISPMNCCWAASACCRTGRSATVYILVFRHETLRSAFEAIL